MKILIESRQNIHRFSKFLTFPSNISFAFKRTKPPLRSLPSSTLSPNPLSNYIPSQPPSQQFTILNTIIKGRKIIRGTFTKSYKGQKKFKCAPSSQIASFRKNERKIIRNNKSCREKCIAFHLSFAF
jgi:hypothetical protein